MPGANIEPFLMWRFWFFWQISDLLVREGDEDVILSAGARGHVLLLIVKLVVAGLRASDQLGERVVLADTTGDSAKWKEFTERFIFSDLSQELLEFLFTIPEMRARGLVWSLMGKNLSHLDRSLLRLMSVTMFPLLLMLYSVLHLPWMVG